MNCKFDVGDEAFIKVKVKNIFKDKDGIQYGVNIICNNNENLAGSFFHVRDNEIYDTGKKDSPEIYEIVEQILKEE